MSTYPNRTARASRARRFRVPIMILMASFTVAATALQASADVITNTIDTSPDPALEVISLAAGGPDGATSLTVFPQGADGDAGCNIDAGESLVLNVVSSRSTVATVTPSQVTFTACSPQTQPITIHPVAGGISQFSVNIAVNNTGTGNFVMTQATFQAHVTPAAPGAPLVAIGANPNKTGEFALTWAPSAVGANTDLTYNLYRQDADDAAPSLVASGITPENANTIGYLGCSNTWMTVEGYHDLGGVGLWPPIAEYGGRSVDRWADSFNDAWDHYEAQLARFGQPNVIWFQLCENEEHSITYNTVLNAMANLELRSPGVPVYMSPLNSYDPWTLCARLGGDGVTDLIDFSNQAAAEGLALRGPDLGPLTEAMTADDLCHPSKGDNGGRLFLGAQLKEFFDLPGEQYTFGSQNAQEEATWTYFVQAVATSSSPAGVLTSPLSSPSVPVVVDKTAPAAPTLGAPAPDYVGSGDWYKDAVTVTSTDNGDPALADGSPGSGVDPSSVGPAQTFDTSGSHTATDTVLDYATNESDESSLTVQVDADLPVVSISCPTAVMLGATATALWTATDGESGLATAADGSFDVDTSTPGAHTATAPAALDNVGHESAPTSCSYTVIYDFSGFFAPVDNPDITNVVKAGSAIPVKFNLGGDQGLGIMAAGSPYSSLISCTDHTDLDSVEETVQAGGSSLTYDPVEGHYVYVWKSVKSWANTCRQLTIELVDGTTHIAYFKFT